MYNSVQWRLKDGMVYQGLTPHSTQHRSFRRWGPSLSSDVHISFSNGGPARALTRVAFVYNGPKGMELAPNPGYSGGSKSSMRLI